MAIQFFALYGIGNLMQSFIKLILGVLAGISLSGLSMVFASESKNLFGMNCTVTRLPIYTQQDMTNLKVVFDTGAYLEELGGLKSKGYTRIDLIKDFNVNGNQIKILLGEKCGKNVVRINGQEAVNDLGVDHIQKDGYNLMMYGVTGNVATMITCDLSAMTGNSYKPFDLPTNNSSNNTQNTVNNTGDSVSNILNLKNGISVDSSLPVSEILKALGGNWLQDREVLAKQLGITNYQGTREQNLKIRAYLLSLTKNNVKATNTPEIFVSQQTYNQAKQDIVFNIVKLFGYSRKRDRLGLALENNILTGYVGTRTQNLQIRRFLLNKIKTQTN